MDRIELTILYKIWFGFFSYKYSEFFKCDIYRHIYETRILFWASIV